MMLERRPVVRGFLVGAVGGGLGWVGKHMTVAEFAGAWLVGRQLAAVGYNIVANSAREDDLFGTFWVPAGPLWVQVGPAAPMRIRFSLVEAVVFAAAVTHPELRLDPGTSLRNGVPVFRSEGCA